MLIPFNIQEKTAIIQMAKVMDITPEQIIVQAVRMFLLWKLGKVQMVFLRVIDSKIIQDINPDVENTTPETKITDEIMTSENNSEVHPTQ